MISLNFASKNYRLINRLRIALAGLTAILIAAMVIIVWTGLSVRADAVALEEKVRELEAARRELKPLVVERARVIKDLTDMSVFLELRRFSWIRLLTEIEKVFPVGVALDSVEFNPGDRALTLNGKALSPESLRNLIVGLERTAAFKDPYLKHQSVDKGSIAFNVVAFYQEHQAAGVASGN